MQAIQQELVQIQHKCREQDASQRRLFEKMLGADKQNLAAAAGIQKASTAAVIFTRFYREPGEVGELEGLGKIRGFDEK